MKKILIYTLIITSSLGFTGCTLKKMMKMAKEQQLTVAPSPLELHGDSVRFNVSAKLPVKMLKKNTAYTVTANYKYIDQTKEVGVVTFKAEDFPNSKTQQPEISKNFSFFYEENMMLGDLSMTGTASTVNGKSKSTEPLPIAKGIVTTPRLLEYVYYPSYLPHGYNNQPEYVPTYVDFFFEQGKSKLRNSEKKSDRAKFLDAFVVKKNPTKSVVITGTHSPEGRELINTNLSNERSTVIKNYYFEVLKKNKLQKQKDSIEFITKAVVQDWTEFKNLIKDEPAISAADRNAILKIIDGPGSFVSKEKQLQQLPVYKTLLTKVYPTLRRAKTEILTLKPKKSDATISVLAKEVANNNLPADTLNENELMFAATLTPSLDEKEAIYLAATKKHDSHAAHNNLGAVYLEKALKANGNARKDLVAKAVTHLEIAKGKQESAEVNANLGAAYLMLSQLDKAITALDAATKLSPETDVDKRIKAMRGVTYIRKGDYNSAQANLVSSFNEDAMVTYNRALAQLLVKDYAKAKASIEESIAANPNFAKSYYVAAVIAARQNRTADLAENLKKAIQKDAELRKRAISDIEFIAVFDNPVFKDAIK